MAKARGDMFAGVITRNYKALDEGFDPGEIYFLGSASDMWADSVPENMIRKVLARCNEDDVSEDTWFLFQTKNPARYEDFLESFNPNTVLGITLETDGIKDYEKVSKAPDPRQRIAAAVRLREYIRDQELPYKIMINMEPVMAFDRESIIDAIKCIKPEYFTIGTETGGWLRRNEIAEPHWVDITRLLYAVAPLVKRVYVKKNIWRLAPTEASQRFMFHHTYMPHIVKEHGNVLIEGEPEAEGKVFFMEEESSG